MRPLVAFAGIALAAACSPGPELPRARNVVLIVADTLRADRLGCYGYPRPTSPAIDALAAEGTLYEDNHSQACWTVPSMISLMSGLYVTQDETVLPESATLAETLRAGGLETAGFIANVVLTADRGFERGFDTFVDLGESSALEVAAAFSTWCDAREHPGEPFFAWVHFIDPHWPYRPPEEFDTFEDPPPAFDALWPRWKAGEEYVATLSKEVPYTKFPDAVGAIVEETNHYDGEVRTVDEGVRRIVEALRSSGELEDTLIVIASDHGEMLWEHPHSPMLLKKRIRETGGLPGGVFDLFVNGHRPWYYRDLWNTPLVLRGPGVPRGLRVHGLATNLDIYPTLLEALDLPLVPGLQGQSLYAGRAPERERAFAYGHEASAVIERGGKKLVVYPRKWFALEGGGELPAVLYDLTVDPQEKSDLGKSRPADVAALRARIDEWHASNRRKVISITSERAREALERMGYTDD